MAGRLRIAATGVQDQWLTGDPQFSYFLMNFKRHTKFAFDFVESQFDGNIDFGQILTCRIPGDKGDLVRNMTLKVTLSDPKPDDNSENDMVWCPSVISHLIEYAELIIGGQPIQRLTGEYIYMHQMHHMVLLLTLFLHYKSHLFDIVIHENYLFTILNIFLIVGPSKVTI